MILKNVLIVLLISATSAMSQGLVAVMANSNGVVQRPTNFIAANFSAATNTDVSFEYPAIFANLTSYAQGTFASASASNSVLTLEMSAAYTNSKALARIYQLVNNHGPAGSGTKWANSMLFKVQFTCITRTNGSIFRSVIGENATLASSNIAVYPTNKAIGFEVDNTGAGLTNRIRLIAHNGTNSTNGAWCGIGDIFQRYNIVIKHGGTNGIVQLYVSQNLNQPTNVPLATISNAPTDTGPGGYNAWSMGMFQPNTNDGNIGADIFNASYQVLTNQ